MQTFRSDESNNKLPLLFRGVNMALGTQPWVSIELSEDL